MENFYSKRRHERKEYKPKIYYYYQGKSYAGNLKDISLGGCFIETTLVNNFSLGDSLAIDVPFTTKKKAIRARGQIVWMDDQGCGIEFY